MKKQIRNIGFRNIWMSGYLSKDLKNTLQKEIIKALGVESHNPFYRCMNGKQQMTVLQAEEVEEIFKKHGLVNIWM